MLPHFDPAMPDPLAALIIGQELAAQESFRLLPERKRLLWHSCPACLSYQIFEGIGIDPQAGLVCQLEDGTVVALHEQFLAAGSLQDLTQDLGSRAQGFARFALISLRPENA